MRYQYRLLTAAVIVLMGIQSSGELTLARQADQSAALARAFQNNAGR